MALAMTMALLLAVTGPAMAGCQVKGAATTQEARTANRGATNPSAADGPQVVTTLMAWGNNYSGQLGDETYGNNRTRPVKVDGLRGTKVEALAAGQGHTLALKSDGTVLAWGYNRDGELGDGTNEDSSTPTRVKDFHDPTGHLSGVRAIAAGSSHSLALKGSNTSGQDNKVSGQLGDGTITSSDAPVEVGGLGGGVEEIAADASHVLALKEDGSVWAWGDNFFGELGDGTHGAKADSPEPVRVKDLEGVRAIEGGGWFSLALKEDGTVWAWGYNQDGELGNGAASNAKETKCENTSEPGDAQVVSSCTNSPTPVRVSGLDGVEAIAAGSVHVLALKEDGTVWAWGANDQGQLGNGTKTLGGNTLGINTPLKVKDLSGVKLVAAGLDYSLAGSQ